MAELKKGETTWEQFREEAEYLDGDIRETALEIGSYSGPRPGRSPGPPLAAELNEHERAYADTCARWLELMGGKLPEVGYFRETVLGGRLLSSEEALTLLDSPLAAFVSSEWFESEGVPLIGHLATLSDYELRQEGERAVFLVAPRYRTSRVEINKHGAAGPDGRRQFALQYRTDEGYAKEVRVEPDSVLHNLYEVSVILASHLRADEAGATRFVLTGKWLLAPPLQAEIESSAITLTASLWVSEKTLRRFFLQLQRHLRGGDNRPIEGKARAALLFVAEHTDVRGRKPGWEELTKLWNERYPRWRYNHRADFLKAYRRAEKVLTTGLPNRF